MNSEEAAESHRIIDPAPMGGDHIELTWWPKIGPHFPEYQTIWSGVIWMLTKRPFSQELRTDIPAGWASRAARHYSMYIALADAYQKCAGLSQSLLGAAADVYPSLVLALNNARGFLKRMKLNDRTLGATQEVKPTWEAFQALYLRLTAVRNPTQHEALRPRVRDRDGRILMLRSDRAVWARYQSTAEVTAAANNPERLVEDFREEIQQSLDDVETTLVILNALWRTVWGAYGARWREALTKEVRPYEPKVPPQNLHPRPILDGGPELSAVVPLNTRIVTSVSPESAATYTSTLYPSKWRFIRSM